ncbi:hypothetical protein HUG10_15225 [Halorarum halophilum]|uniref:D-glucuronyl C5-epimerase C-terminal domain-containing protein n=1 Tax=Halorarum halophilum TaxID=2743090 RepID=A0A7D5GG62_9EURY|nr:D-glucuronyl C5-epimerase family protein [Halobaculum halophilum]QLG28808.1 hypothetical protein HUG10_15225 [Halobaculum halophilum]
MHESVRISEDIELRKLPYEEWPESDAYPYNAEEAEEMEARTNTYEGNTGLQVVQNARVLTNLSENVRTSDDPVFEDAAERVTDTLVEAAHGTPEGSTAEAIYFPYGYHFKLHGNPDLLMETPWYSGMAQGLLLSSFTRLYRQTGDERYSDLADRTFASLVPSGGSERSKPWVSLIEDGHYWIEEYPSEVPAHTLNGKMFGIYGLYEYWCHSGREDVETWLLAALTTISDRIEEFRVPGGLSYYCLEHEGQIDKYHSIHIGQLEALYDMTGHDRFHEVAETFRSDHAP